MQTPSLEGPERPPFNYLDTVKRPPSEVDADTLIREAHTAEARGSPLKVMSPLPHQSAPSLINQLPPSSISSLERPAKFFNNQLLPH
jgi:hypothetical protein